MCSAITNYAINMNQHTFVLHNTLPYYKICRLIGGRDEEVARAYVTDGQRDRKLLEHIRESMKLCVMVKYRVHITWEYYKVYIYITIISQQNLYFSFQSKTFEKLQQPPPPVLLLLFDLKKKYDITHKRPQK